MLSLFTFAASSLKPGQKTTVSNNAGDSYTVEIKPDGTHNVYGNNQQSRDKLSQP